MKEAMRRVDLHSDVSALFHARPALSVRLTQTADTLRHHAQKGWIVSCWSRLRMAAYPVASGLRVPLPFHPWMPSFSGGTELPVIVVTVLYVQKKGVDALIHREERAVLATESVHIPPRSLFTRSVLPHCFIPTWVSES